MPRCCKHRKVHFQPKTCFFKPRGIPLCDLEMVFLQKDEMEAIRLADYLKMYHEEAAHSMGVSRQTFGNILHSAHYKIAQALLLGKAIQIESDTETKMHQSQAL